jgi:hypothetical protein
VLGELGILADRIHSALGSGEGEELLNSAPATYIRLSIAHYMLRYTVPD